MAAPEASPNFSLKNRLEASQGLILLFVTLLFEVLAWFWRLLRARVFEGRYELIGYSSAFPTTTTSSEA